MIRERARRAPWVLATACALLVGCSSTAVVERLVPEDVREFVSELEPLVLRADPALRDRMTPEGASRITEETLAQIRAYVPRDASPDAEGRWIQVASSENEAGDLVEAVRELEIQGRIFLLSYRITRVDAQPRLVFVGINEVPPEQLEAMGLSLQGRSALHYAVFALLLGLPGAVLATWVAIWRTRRLKRRVLWSLFAVLGLAVVSFDWLSGEFSSALVAVEDDALAFTPRIMLFSAAYFQQLYGPTVVTLGFPFGVALFWLQRHRGRLRLKDEGLAQGAPADASAVVRSPDP